MQRKPHTLRVAVLLDKAGVRRKRVHPDYVGFQIPDEFVVGYGLDFAGLYRNLKDICVLGTPARGRIEPVGGRIVGARRRLGKGTWPE
jgi:hypoxanthine-guanine phosphoribosyltransferase